MYPGRGRWIEPFMEHAPFRIGLGVLCVLVGGFMFFTLWELRRPKRALFWLSTMQASAQTGTRTVRAQARTMATSSMFTAWLSVWTGLLALFGDRILWLGVAAYAVVPFWPVLYLVLRTTGRPRVLIPKVFQDKSERDLVEMLRTRRMPTGIRSSGRHALGADGLPPRIPRQHEAQHHESPHHQQ